VCSLQERVSILEGLLKEQNIELPHSNHPPLISHDSAISESSLQPKESEMDTRHYFPPITPVSTSGSSSSPDKTSAPFAVETQEVRPAETDAQHDGDDAVILSDHSLRKLPSLRKSGMLSRLLSTRMHLSFDGISRPLRYFGPTTNCHIHSEFNIGEVSQKLFDQTRRVEKVIRYLSTETHDYLMNLFWQHYNSVLHMIHQEAFQSDWVSGRTQFYSGFLHILILAIGYKFADRSRPDIQAITLPRRESTLHREAIYMLDLEVEGRAGIPSVIAFMLLAELEAVAGRDNLGWLYSGMGMR
jgi:hypothetical protein